MRASRRALDLTARSFVAGGRAVLFADETDRELARLLRRNGVAGTEAMRSAFRELVLATPALHRHVAAVQVQADQLGRPEVLAAQHQGVLIGVRADVGAHPAPGAATETITRGLTGLGRRLAALAAGGASFASWRTVFVISKSRRTPTPGVVRANAAALARFASACHAVGLMPLLVVDMLMDGDHDAWACAEATASALGAVSDACAERSVDAACAVVATGMAVEGLGSRTPTSPEAVAIATAAALIGLPTELAGVALLTGSQRFQRLVTNVAAVGAAPAPWPRGIASGRLLTGPVLAAWRGRPAAVESAQAVLLERVSRLRSGLVRDGAARRPQRDTGGATDVFGNTGG